MKALYTILVVAALSSCNTNANVIDSEKDSVTLNYENIPAERTSVNPNPVKTYSETIESFEITDAFKVALYETKETFDYLIKIQYKQLDAEDTLRIPNFGIQPSVEIRKGATRPSCVIGFLDKEKKFRESKLIYFENSSLKIKVLKYYAVSTYIK